jgi:hypothetical protein
MQVEKAKEMVVSCRFNAGDAFFMSSSYAKASVVVSTLGRRSRLFFENKEIGMMTEKFEVIDFYEDDIKIEVKKGLLFVDRVVFFESTDKVDPSVRKKETYDFFIEGVLF